MSYIKGLIGRLSPLGIIPPLNMNFSLATYGSFMLSYRTTLEEFVEGFVRRTFVVATLQKDGKAIAGKLLANQRVLSRRR